MKYNNVFDTQAEFEAAKASLPIPQLAYVTENDSINSLTDFQPYISHEMVNLGLSTNYSNMLIGATCKNTKESWYGGYYCWAEKFTKSAYAKPDYTLWTGHQSGSDWIVDSVDKYNTEDGMTSLGNSEDPGTIIASAYRSIQPSEVDELLDTTKITREWKTDYMGVPGLNGVLFTSKVSGYAGNCIFVPAAGKRNESGLEDDGQAVYIWTILRDGGDATCQTAISFRIGSDCTATRSDVSRHVGMSILSVVNFV